MSKARHIGILVNLAATFDRAVARGVAMFARGRPPWACAILNGGATAAQALHDVGQANLHGLVACCPWPDVLEAAAHRETAIINVSPDVTGSSQVGCDEAAIGRLGAEHLASLGVRNFAFVGRTTRPYVAQRREGFVRRLVELGLECWGASETADTGWLAQAPKPLGVLAATDDLGATVLRECRAAGVAAPGSVAVLGTGNDEIVCELAGLSSVALAGHRIGYEAGRQLDELMRARQPAPMLMPPAGVARRASTDLFLVADQQVATAVRFIRHHAHEHLSVTDVLGQLSISRRSLEQRFLRNLGRTPADEIRRARVEVAKQTLAETDQTMEYVARTAGFNDAKQLGGTFQRHTGMTPTGFRRLYRGT